MNLQDKWINLLNPIYIEDETKRKKIQIIIFFSITFGLTYLLGFLLYFKQFIDPENFGLFMMILPLSSVSIAKFYTEGMTNDKYKFYSLIILFFIIYLFLLIIELLNLINNQQFQSLNTILVIISSLFIILYSDSVKDLYLIKNIKIGSLLIFYFMLSKIIPISFSLIMQGNQPNYEGILNYIFSFMMSFFSIYLFFGEEYGWRGFLQDICFDRFGKKIGVIALSMCWNLWHLPLIFTLYTPETPVLGLISRSIYIFGISIFLGYVYMKTKNVWFCAVIHALNNTSFLISTSNLTYGTTITHSDIVEISILILIFYVPFLFTKEYRQNT
ncbi:CAAX protease self-immunity family protein [Clostridioides difficile CD160]|nr:CAAX protease self-immunity family protein [Clostridioides difficile CD160]MBY2476431.1 CPBP family intramembrane metalloprotease [Clostridioides difficile]